MADLIVLDSSFTPPPLIDRAGDRAARRFLEYFTVNIRNKNTRAAYARAATDFLYWCETSGLYSDAVRLARSWAGYVDEPGALRPGSASFGHEGLNARAFFGRSNGAAYRHGRFNCRRIA